MKLQNITFDNAETEHIQLNRFALVASFFEAEKTVYMDDGRTIEGYDGKHYTDLILFANEKELDTYIEEVSTKTAEEGDGSEFKVLWSGIINNLI